MSSIINRLWDRWTRKNRPARTAPRRRQRLQVERLEERCNPIIAILIGHPAIAVNPQPLPPMVQVDFDWIPQAILSDVMTPAGPKQDATGLLLKGHGSEAVSESVVQTPSSGLNQAPPGPTNIPIDVTYNFLLDGAVQDQFSISFGTIKMQYQLQGRSAATFVYQDAGGLPHQGRADAEVAIQGSLSGTWTDTGNGTILIGLDSVTVDSASHQTETVDAGATPAGLMPQTWTMDSTSHTTGTLTDTFIQLGHGMPASFGDGSVRFIQSASSSLTDQIHARVAAVPAPGTPPPLSPYLIDAVFMAAAHDQASGSSLGRRIYKDIKVVTGALSEVVTPPPGSGNPYNIFANATSTGSLVAHLPPTVVLAAPVALAPQGFVSTTSPTLTWTAVPGATAYSFTLIDLDTPIVEIGTVATNSFTVANLIPGDLYVWYVWAMDNGGDASPPSNSLMFAVTFGSK